MVAGTFGSMHKTSNRTEAIPFPVEGSYSFDEFLDTWIRLAAVIRWSEETGGPGRKVLYAAARRGDLRASRPGGRWFYVTPRDYFEWRNRQRIETAEQRRERLVRQADALYRGARTLKCS